MGTNSFRQSLLLSEAKNGNLSAIKKLIEINSPMAETEAVRIALAAICVDAAVLLDPNECEDLFQEGNKGLADAVGKAVKSGENFEKPGSFSRYLKKEVKRSLENFINEKRSILENTIRIGNIGKKDFQSLIREMPDTQF